MFIMFPESALKNVKTMKQRCSALITSGTSTRVVKTSRYLYAYTKHYRLLISYIFCWFLLMPHPCLCLCLDKCTIRTNRKLRFLPKMTKAVSQFISILFVGVILLRSITDALFRKWSFSWSQRSQTVCDLRQDDYVCDFLYFFKTQSNFHRIFFLPKCTCTLYVCLERDSIAFTSPFNLIMIQFSFNYPLLEYPHPSPNYSSWLD